MNRQNSQLAMGSCKKLKSPKQESNTLNFTFPSVWYHCVFGGALQADPRNVMVQRSHGSLMFC